MNRRMSGAATRALVIGVLCLMTFTQAYVNVARAGEAPHVGAPAPNALDFEDIREAAGIPKDAGAMKNRPTQESTFWEILRNAIAQMVGGSVVALIAFALAYWVSGRRERMRAKLRQGGILRVFKKELAENARWVNRAAEDVTAGEQMNAQARIDAAQRFWAFCLRANCFISLRMFDAHVTETGSLPDDVMSAVTNAYWACNLVLGNAAHVARDFPCFSSSVAEDLRERAEANKKPLKLASQKCKAAAKVIAGNLGQV